MAKEVESMEAARKALTEGQWASSGNNWAVRRKVEASWPQEGCNQEIEILPLVGCKIGDSWSPGHHF